MSHTIPASDERLRWHGAVSLEHGPGWMQPWRIRYEERMLFHELLVERAATAAGVRLAFRTDSVSLSLELEPPVPGKPMDVACNGELLGQLVFGEQTEARIENLPAGEKAVELWLSQMGPTRVRALRLDDGAKLAVHEDKRKRWITYGSSISQCGAAESPAYTWPAVAARKRDLNLTCFGFSGQCHLDAMVGRQIRDLPADYLSMCLGINVQGAGSLSPRTFRSSVIGLIVLIREKHADIPLAVISPIISPPRESTPNKVEMTLQGMREEIASAVEVLRARGDKALHYVSGLDLFGEGDLSMLPDQLHPDAAGYKLMGERFADNVAAKYFV